MCVGEVGFEERWEWMCEVRVEEEGEEGRERRVRVEVRIVEGREGGRGEAVR